MSLAISQLERPAWGALATAFALGLFGAWPRADGGPDPLALTAWLVLVAPAAGILCGANGVRLLPMGLVVPALWMVLFVEVDLFAARDVAHPVACGLVWSGLYLGGLGLGAVQRGGAVRTAALAGLLTGTLACLATLTGLLTGEGGFAAAHPEVQAVLLEVSPLALAFDAAGWDWTHANPHTYRLGGVEWVLRKAWSGGLAGCGACVVGCVLAIALPKWGRTRLTTSP